MREEQHEALAYRSLTFRPPRDWTATSRIQLGDPSGALIEVAVESRAPTEPLAAFAKRTFEGLRQRADRVELVTSTAAALGGRPAHLFHVRLHAKAFPLGAVERVLVVVDHGDPQRMSLLSMTALASSFAERRDTWTRFASGVRFDEIAPAAPRIRPHVASFEPPAGWEESVTYTFLRAPPAVGAITLQVEPLLVDEPFRTTVDRKVKAQSVDREVLDSAAALTVGGRSAHRSRLRNAKTAIVETVLVVDGGGASDNVTVVTGAARDGDAEVDGALRVLADSIRIGRPGLGPQPRRVRAQGASTRGLVLEGKTPSELHVELMGKGFVPIRLPLAAPTTRAGERRFLRTDGRTTGELADRMLASELVYLHEDGGTVRVFPDGHPSAGFGGTAPGSVRVSMVAHGVRDPSFDAEELVVGREGKLPRSVCAGHGLAPCADPETEAELAHELVVDSWSTLRSGPSVALPMQDKVGLRITRTIVPDRDFDEIIGRVERLAGSFDAQRVETDGVIRFVFVGPTPVPCSASLVVELGAHVLTVDPIGHAVSVDRLQRFLRKLLRDERYRVFDDATGEDVTATAERTPSFLVAPTRRRPVLFTSAG